jgi:small conductance mechanosensitive channel
MTFLDGVVYGLQSFFASTQQQLLGTLVAVLSYLIVVGLTYELGQPVKDRLRVDDETVEAVQAAIITVSGLVGAAFLVIIWHSFTEVEEALDSITISSGAAIKALVTFLAFGAAYTLTRVTKRFIKHGARRDAISAHQREVLHHVVQVAVYIPAFLFSFALWNFNPGNVLIGAGALGIVLGLAARQTLGAVLAGFVVLFSRPFEVGDWVEIDEEEGIVTDISIVNTHLRTFDDEEVMIPNDQVTTESIVNRSRNGRLRIQVDVGVDYDTDIGNAATVAQEAMEARDEVWDRRSPEVVYERFGDNAVVLGLRFWIHRPTIRKKWAAQNAVVEAVKAAYEREGITIPFPQRTVGARAEGALVATGSRVVEGAEDEPEPAIEAVEETDGGREADE